jgi:hypothetical protein
MKKVNKWHTCIGLLLLLGVPIITPAQFDISFSLVAQKNQLTIGEPVLVSMRLSFPSSLASTSVVFPSFKDSTRLNDSIDIVSIKPVATAITQDNQGKSIYTWQQDFELVFFAGGTISIPAFKSVVDGDTVATNILTFSVDAPEVNLEEGIRAMKDIDEDPFTWWERFWLWLKNYGLWVLILLIVGAIAGYYYYRLKNTDKTPNALLPELPFYESLLVSLDRIEQQELWQQNKHKEYYTEVTTIIRKYIEHKYEIATLEKTSFELLESLKLCAINKSDYQQLSSLFGLSDMIKFAKSLPSAQENIQAIDIAKKLIKRAIEVRNKKQSKTHE